MLVALEGYDRTALFYTTTWHIFINSNYNMTDMVKSNAKNYWYFVPIRKAVVTVFLRVEHLNNN
jgi:hypothetical protein